MQVQDALVMLMKFQNRDKLEMLQNGLMYMKPLQYYIDFEKKSLKKFIADDLEAQARTIFQNIQIFNNDDNTLFLEGTNGLSTLSLGYESNPVFCMFSFDMRNCHDEKLDGNKLEYRMAFTDKQKYFLNVEVIFLCNIKRDFFQIKCYVFQMLFQLFRKIRCYS